MPYNMSSELRRSRGNYSKLKLVALVDILSNITVVSCAEKEGLRVSMHEADLSLGVIFAARWLVEEARRNAAAAP